MYVECKTERIFGIACLGKKLAFDTEICYYFEYIFSKIGLFDRVKEWFKSNQTRYGVSPGYVECKTERIFGIVCLGKKFVFQRKYRLIRLLFAYSIFKNIEISSGQGVVQIKPNSVWSIPRVCRM